MGKLPKLDLQAISVEFRCGAVSSATEADWDLLASLYLRALDELGYRRKNRRVPTRVRNAPKRTSVRGVTYGK